jgi:hypothetical protein
VKLNLTQRENIHNAHARVTEFAAMQFSPLCIGQQGNRLVAHAQGRETIMANVSKVILGAAIAVVSIASPALAAHKGKPISAHQNGYVTQSSQRSGVRAFASVPRSVDDPAVTGGGSIGYNQNLRLNQW